MPDDPASYHRAIREVEPTLDELYREVYGRTRGRLTGEQRRRIREARSAAVRAKVKAANEERWAANKR
jgi:ABC-type oligopeptide transport system ATPase subunit